MRPLLIGIAGGTASGKSSIAEIIYNNFKDTNSICIIKEDDFYKDQTHLPMEERAKTNYDHPLAFDRELILDFLTKLINGQEAIKPIYDFTVHNRSDKTEVIKPCDVIIFDGLFALYSEEIRKLLDIKIFVDTPSDVRFIRRFKRDQVERKRTAESIINQYLTTVKPMHDQFVEPSKIYADLIIPQGKENVVAIDLLNAKIDSILREKML